MRKILLFASCLTVLSVHSAEVQDTVTLPNFEVSAIGKSDVTLLPLNVRTISEQEINKSAEVSLLPVLQTQVPGLFVTERGFAGYGVSNGSAGMVNIRGVGQSNKVLFMIDGMPQTAGLFGHSLPDVYNSTGVSRVEVVKGPSSLFYGSGAMGGSVNIITHRNHPDGWTGNARAAFGSFNTQRFNLGTGFKSGRFEANVAGHLNRSNGYRKNSAFWDAGELMQLKYSAGSHWTVGATTELTQTDSEYAGTIYEPLNDMRTYMFRGSSAVYAHDNYGKFHGGVQAFITWGNHKVDDGYRADIEGAAAADDYLFHSTDYNMGFSLYQTMHFIKGNDLSVGLDFQHWGGHSWNTMKADDAVVEGVRKCENEVGAYIMMQQAFWGDILSINGGVRLQHGSTYGNEWIPQAGFILRPYSGASVKFSFGRGFRAPNIKELYMFRPANPDLKPESMYNYDVELRQFLIDNRLNLGLSLYYISARNMIQTIMVDGRPKNMNTGKFINKGIEFDCAYRIDDVWNIGASYAYLHSSNAELQYAPKNMLNAHVDFTPGDLSVTLENQNIFGLKNGAPDNASTAYSLLNMRVAYTFHSVCDIRPFIKLDNITDHHYEIIYGCPMPGITILGGVEMTF